MELTALIIYSTECSSCAVFKEKYEGPMLAVFASKGVKAIKYESIARQPLKGVSPTFLRYVSYFPCIILIDTDTLRVADSLSLNLVLSLIAPFNGETLKHLSPTYFTSIQSYRLNPESFALFVDDYRKRRSAEKQLMGSVQTESVRTATRATTRTPNIASRVQIVNRWGS